MASPRLAYWRKCRAKNRERINVRLRKWYAASAT